MRAVITTEKRLNEAFELTLARIAPIDSRAVEPTVLRSTVAAELDRLKAEIRDGGF
jgi:hypothetical protein